MSKQNLYIGKRGEEAAISFLKENGYKILTRNYKTRLGEIDIIAFDKDTLCFIEIKTRNSDRFGSGLEAVSRFKQRQISKVALSFLKDNNFLGRRARFDVASVTYLNDKPKLDLIKNAFELEARYVI